MIGSDESFEKDDVLNRKKFCRRLERYLAVEKNFVAGSVVVSLCAPFGWGKTTFLRKWLDDLDLRRVENPDTPNAILLSAWKDDYCHDPLVPIISSLIEEVKRISPLKSEKIKDVAKAIFWFGAKLGNQLASAFTPFDPIEVGEFVEGKLSEELPDAIEYHSLRKKKLDELITLLTEVFGEEEQKLFVFVDELDRCRPDFAVSYLETIKHVFNIPSIAFVISCDVDQLKKTISVLYGDLDFSEYFRRFIHREFILPTPTPDELAEFTRKHISSYLEKEDLRLTRAPEYSLESLCSLIVAFCPRPRQIEHIFRLIGYALEDNFGEVPKAHIRLVYASFCQFMCVLKVVDPEFYHKIGKGIANPKQFAEHFEPIFESNDLKEWVLAYAAGKIRFSESEMFYNELIGMDFGRTKEEVLKELTQHRWTSHGLPETKDPIALIYKTIENASNFSQ